MLFQGSQGFQGQPFHYTFLESTLTGCIPDPKNPENSEFEEADPENPENLEKHAFLKAKP